jgi:hypothetical protein
MLFLKTFHVSRFTSHGLLAGLFEHPACYTPIAPTYRPMKFRLALHLSALSLNHRIAVYEIQGFIRQNPGA